MANPELGIDTKIIEWQQKVMDGLEQLGTKRTPLVNAMVQRGLTVSPRDLENVSLSSVDQDGIQIGNLPGGDTKFWVYPDGKIAFNSHYPDGERSDAEVDMEVRTKAGNRIFVPGLPVVTSMPVAEIAYMKFEFVNQSLWEQVEKEEPFIDLPEAWEQIQTLSSGNEPVALCLTQASGANGPITRVDLHTVLKKDNEYIIANGATSGPRAMLYTEMFWQNGVLTHRDQRPLDTSWYHAGRYSTGRYPAKEPYTIKPRQ